MGKCVILLTIYTIDFYTCGHYSKPGSSVPNVLPLIALKADGFAPRYKPPGRSFDACAKGKLLLLAPVEDRAMYGAPPNRPTHHNGAKQPAAARD